MEEWYLQKPLTFRVGLALVEEKLEQLSTSLYENSNGVEEELTEIGHIGHMIMRLRNAAAALNIEGDVK